MFVLMTADSAPDLESAAPVSKEELLGRVAQGDEAAFGELYDQIAPRVLGLVDRIRASQAGRDRDTRIGIRDLDVEYDNVSETVEVRIEHERVKKAMSRLAELQRQVVSLAYDGGYSHSEVAGLLRIPLGTVKTRLSWPAAMPLNSLSPEEAVAFERHLAESEQARIEAAELGDTAVALGLATAPVQPSAALKDQLMARLASTPQLPPLPVAEAAPARDARPATDAAPAAPAPPAASAPPTRTGAAERARKRRLQGPGGFALAAAVAIVLFVGGAFVGQVFNTNQFVQRQGAALAQINAAPDSQRAATTTKEGHAATLVWSGELGLSALMIKDLPALPGDKDYQLWYINSAGALSAGTFDSTGTGTVWRVLDGTMKAGDQVGVTVEPKGGSAQPTSDPIVAIQS
jgi:anti-sigma-K factor RskA